MAHDGGRGEHVDNPNGIESQSSGLRVVPVRKDRATLGHRPTNIPNRNAVATISFSLRVAAFCHNRVAVELISELSPKVAPRNLGLEVTIPLGLVGLRPATRSRPGYGVPSPILKLVRTPPEIPGLHERN